MSNEAYNKLKLLVTIVLPALITLYLACAGIWDLPHTEKIAGTLSAISIFLGVILRSSSKRYANREIEYDGELSVVKIGDHPDELLLGLSHEQADTIRSKDEVIFKVNVQ